MTLALLAESALNATVFTTTILNTSSANTAGTLATSAPGFGTSSWQAAAPGAGSKSEFYVDPSTLFGYGITVGEIQSISYWTDKPGDSTTPDWSLYIYTDPQPGDTRFYHSRLTAEPYLTGTVAANDPANTWAEWSTDGGTTNALRFYDFNRDGGVNGTGTDPTLSQLQDSGGAYTWGATSISNNYNPEAVEFISLQTATSWGYGFSGLVDGLTINLTNGDSAVVNLEAAPEPETFTLACLAVVALLAQHFLGLSNYLVKMRRALKAFRV